MHSDPSAFLEITELFSSLQGEGPYTGKPAFFIRLSRCVPPHCPWCDTPRALVPGKRIPVDDLVQAACSSRNDFIVITGGEPFLQWHSGLARLAGRLVEKGCTIQYETSGKLPLPRDTRGVTICSPKYLDGTWHFAEENLARVDAFKFVVGSDFTAVDTFILERKIPAEKVWIMPLGANREEQLQRLPAMWDYCASRGYSLSPRLHTLIFNDKQGI